jgi:hypothetical protein
MQGRFTRFIHHRSLTASIIELLFAFFAFAFLPEQDFRIQRQGLSYLVPAAVTALLGVVVCILTLIILLRDNRSGYPAIRCSLATLLWAMGCVPILFLAMSVAGSF